MYDKKQKLIEAVNDLISDPDPRPKIEAMDVVFEVSNRHPVKLSGEMAVLNSLVTLRREDPDAYEALCDLVDTRREARGLHPCWPDQPREKFADRKNEYQRQLMAKKRERANRATDIENLQRPFSAQLRGNTRLEFERTQENEWGRRRDSMLAAAAAHKPNGKLTRTEMADLRAAFWSAIDAELDERERLIRVELGKPAGQRRAIP